MQILPTSGKTSMPDEAMWLVIYFVTGPNQKTATYAVTAPFLIRSRGVDRTGRLHRAKSDDKEHSTEYIVLVFYNAIHYVVVLYSYEGMKWIQLYHATAASS